MYQHKYQFYWREMINSLKKRGTLSKKEKIDPDDVRKAIYLIDSYRAHLFYDIS